ncbi:hypothetical protein KA005_09400, partial [bacterium]|nr:hypothetical protein [bacterium]
MLPWHWRVIYWLTFFPLGVILFITLLLKGIALKLFGVPLGRISRKSSPNLSNKRPVRLLCLAYLNDNNASARYRLYKYTNYVSKNEVEFHIVPPTSS